jgi:polyisoprenoid-binding protein YceI
MVILREESAEGATERMHAVMPKDWHADVCFDSALPHRSWFRFVADSNSLRIDTPEARKVAGIEDSAGPEDVRKLQVRLIEAVGSDEYPEIRFQSMSTRLEDRTLLLEGWLSVKGKTARLVVPLTTEAGSQGSLWFRGEAAITLTTLGLQPVSLSEELRLQDAVKIRFALLGRLTNRPCP